MSFRIPPLLQVVLCSAISWGLSRLAPSMVFDGAWRHAAALLFFGLGMIILVLAASAFIRARTTVNPVKPENVETLVTTGLYSFSRNPMYLAMAMILFGFAFLLGNLAAFVGCALFIWAVTVVQIKPEERALERKFGDKFERYRLKTRRWI